MKTKQKPVEQLQAQVALYADVQNETKHTGRTRQLLLKLGEVGLYANDVPEHVTFPRQEPKKRPNEEGVAIVVEPAGTPVPLFDKKEYADFLKDPLTREQSHNLAEMRSNYHQVEDQVNKLNLPFNDYEKAGEHVSSIGRGSSKAAFEFRATIDGQPKDLVAIISHGKEIAHHAQAMVLDRAANLALVKGKAGFEQGVAWSNDPPVVVAERALGHGLDELSPKQRAAIPAKHWDDLTTNVTAVADLGISLDAMLSNFLYDPEKGFTIIDFRRGNPGQEQAMHTQNLLDIQSLHKKVVSAVTDAPIM